MTYELYLGDRTYSSWSLRGWLMFAKFGLPVRVHMVGLYAGTMAEDLAALTPARLVPAMRTPEGIAVGETMAMAETLAERHPQAGLWPKDPAHRAAARWLCAEMASGFSALRADCPMQLVRCYEEFEPSDAVLADLARVEQLWAHARAVSGSKTGWLFGDYSLADAFYTPVAARILGYGLPVTDASHDYVLQLLSDDAVREWRTEGLKVQYDPEPYAMDLSSTPWPIE